MEEILKNINKSINELKTSKEYIEELEEERKTNLNNIKKLYEEKSFYLIGSPLLEVKQKEIDNVKEKNEKLEEKISRYKEELYANVSDKKEEMKQSILSEIGKYKFQSEIENENNKIKQMEASKNSYTKVAENAEKDLKDAQQKLSAGDMSGLDKLTRARGDFEQYKKCADDLDKEISEKQKEVKEYKSIEGNQKAYADLESLLMKVSTLSIDRLDKFEGIKMSNNVTKPEVASVETKTKQGNVATTKIEKTTKNPNKSAPEEVKEKIETKKTPDTKPTNEIKPNEEKRKNVIKMVITQNGLPKYIFNSDKEDERVFGDDRKTTKYVKKMAKEYKNDNMLLNEDKRKVDPYLLVSLLEKDKEQLVREYLDTIEAETLLSDKNIEIHYDMSNLQNMGIINRYRFRNIVRKAKELGANVENFEEVWYRRAIEKIKEKATKKFKKEEEIKAISEKSERTEESFIEKLKVNKKTRQELNEESDKHREADKHRRVKKTILGVKKWTGAKLRAAKIYVQAVKDKKKEEKGIDR